VHSRFLSFAAAALLSLVAVRAEAADGIQIVQQVTGSAGAATIRMQLDRSHIRAEITAAGGAQQVVLFDGTRQVIDIVDVTRRTYMEMTKADLDRMATQLQGVMAAMQQQMANMPPAQRAQMEAMMRGRGMPGAAAGAVPKTEYRRSGTDHVGRWTCDKYDGYQNGAKTSELCTVAPSALGFGATGLDVTRQLTDFYAKLVPQSADQLVAIGRMEDQGFAGFPVRRSFTMGTTQGSVEVTEAGRVTLPATAFTVPPGFTKTEMPNMAGPAGGRGRQ
jgi:hypothetical protein